MSRFNISLNIGLVTSTGKPLREYFNADVLNIMALLAHRLSGQIQDYALAQFKATAKESMHLVLLSANTVAVFWKQTVSNVQSVLMA